MMRPRSAGGCQPLDFVTGKKCKLMWKKGIFIENVEKKDYPCHPTWGLSYVDGFPVAQCHLVFDIHQGMGETIHEIKRIIPHAKRRGKISDFFPTIFLSLFLLLLFPRWKGGRKERKTTRRNKRKPPPPLPPRNAKNETQKKKTRKKEAAFQWAGWFMPHRSSNVSCSSRNNRIKGGQQL